MQRLEANHIFRYLNAAVLIAFCLTSIGVHLSEIHAPDKDAARCTAYDTPANCWDQGGKYRALDFVSPTTGLTFVDIGVGVVYNPDGSTRPLADAPYDVVFDAADKTASKRQATCATEFPDADAVTAGDQVPEERLACLAERLPDLWEIPNRGLARDQWTLAGGIHMWYFMWLSLWISASFAVTMLPNYWGARYLKFPVVMVWHFIGIVVTVMAFIDDPYFQLRLPLNNVIVGCALQALAALAQCYWELEAMYDDGPEYATVVAAGKSVEASYPAARGVPMRLTALMTLGEGSSAGSRRSSRHSAKTLYDVDGNELPTAEDAAVSHARDMFDWKARNMELIEALNIELALTLPLVLLAVFSMASRVNIDWVVSSLFMRSTLFFFGLAACFKTLKFHREAAHHGLGGILRVAVAVFAATMIYLVAWIIFDWYHPMAQTTSHWGDAFPSGLSSVAMLTLVATVMLAALFLIGVLVAGVAFPGATHLEDTAGTEKFAYLTLQTLLLIVRVFVFTCSVAPKTWYGAFDEKIVPLNYPPP